MISRYEAYMDGVALSSISDKLLILDISHEAPRFENRSVQIAKRNGLYIADRYRESAQVTITFALRIYDIAERQHVCQEVVRWAMGKILQTNDRPNQRLRVICETPPVIESALNWLDAISVVFNGYIVPFWEDAIQSTAVVTGATGTLYVPGNVPQNIARTVVEVSVEPYATITGITLGCGETSITLSGIHVSSAETLVIDYDEQMNLRIRNGDTSYLNKRTAASSDDLLAVCGAANTLAVDCTSTVKATFKARGLWL